jgi:hypothetical protein
MSNHWMEEVMGLKSAVLATAFVFMGGCAQTGTVRPPPQQDEIYAPDAGVTSSGASTSGRTSAGGGERSREEVHAEAVEAVRNHKSTLMDELEWFNPFAKGR